MGDRRRPELDVGLGVTERQADPLRAVAHRVLHAFMAHESRAGLQVSPPDKIEPAGVTQHVRVRFQGGEFRRQFQPVKHSPERGWLHPEHPICGPLPRLA